MILRLLPLFLSATVGAAPAFVGVRTKAQTGSQVTSFNINFTPTAGNLIIIVLACSTSDITWTLDSPQATFQQDAYRAGGGIDDTISIWSAGDSPGVAHTVTVDVSDLEFVRYAVLEFSGMAATSYVIATNVNSSTSQSITTGNVTTATNNTLLFAACRTDGDETAHGDIGVGTSFTLCYPYSGGEPDQKMMCEYRVVSAGTYGNGFTLESQDGGGWVAAIVAYKPLESQGGEGAGAAYRNKGKSVAKGFGPVF